MNANIEASATNPPNGKRRRILLLIAVIFIVIGVLWAAYWVLVLEKREKTDDAYVNGNRVVISAQVAGTVIAVLADDTQLVNSGQVLVKLDPTDAQTALSRAASALGSAVRQVRQQKATAGQYDSEIETRKLELSRAQIDLAKREPLVADQAIAGEEVRHAQESVRLARAALAQAERQSLSAHALVDGTPVEEQSDGPAGQGRVSRRLDSGAAQCGCRAGPGMSPSAAYNWDSTSRPAKALMTVIPLHSLWVDANFKEVQLRNLRIGQKAEVRSDLYGGSFIFHGHVQGMSAGTGAAFSLLPPQNASGNWIKVVQRVPVRILIDDNDLIKSPLRVGLSATVTVDTTDRGGPVLAAQASDKPVGDTQVYTQDLEKANAEADAVVRQNLGTGR